MDNFVHIPKASGSTLRTILSRQYGVEHILYYEPGSKTWTSNREGETPAQYLARRVASGEVNLVTGHHAFGLHEMISRQMRSFAIMRDPIARALSDFYYAHSYEHHRYREEILEGKLSVEEFLSEQRYGMQDTQVRMIGGRWGYKGEAESAAIQNATLCFAAIGTTERFEESVLFIAKVMGWKPPLFVKRNVTRLESGASSERRESDQFARENFKKYFEGEYRLYGHVDSLLNQRIAALGPGFGAALDAYRGIQAEIEKSATSEIYDLYEFGRNDALPPYAAQFLDSEAYRAIEDYLASPPENMPRPRNYRGFVDVCEGQQIAGWALDLWSDAPIEVTLARAGQKFATTKCSLMRADVAKSLDVRPQVGFRFDLNESIADPKDYSICFGDTSLPLQRRL